MNTEKPYSEACDRNREPILAVLREVFSAENKVCSVLEIGSGTGQHAVYFAAHLPHLTWQSSDREEHHAGINAWIDGAQLVNVRRPLPLDVRDTPWPVTTVDAVYTANTLHIMDSVSVDATFHGVGQILRAGGTLVVYGPFNYNRAFTSASNARFDAQLRARGVGSALRDFEAVDALARGVGLTLLRDAEMPANNRLLVWRKTA